MVADLEAAHTRPHVAHDAGSLVTPAIRKVGELHVAGGKVVVGVAEPAGGELDEHLVLLGAVEFDLDHLPLSRLLEEHSGLGFHSSPSRPHAS